MAISLNTAGSWAYAASGSVSVTLPTHATGNMLIVRVAYKSSAIATCAASTATSGWAKVGEFVGTGNSGNGTGGVSVAAFWKIATSAAEAAPTIDFSQTVTQVGHVALSYAKAAGETWNTPVGAGGEDTTADTSKSMTMGSHVSTTAGDMVDFFLGVRDDCTMTSPTFTQTGVTFGTVSEQPATAGTDTSGADGAYDGGYRLASSGTSSAAAVVTGTLNTSETGSAWTTRLRVFTPELHSGSLVGTGGGVYTNGGQKGAQLALAGTGGGVATIVGEAASVENHDGAVTGTGAGVATVGQTTDRGAVLAGTGGGILTADSSTARDAALTGSGAGVATVGQTTDRPGELTGTGAGVAAFGGQAGFAAALAATGGGAATIGQTTDRLLDLTATGGGAATITGSQAEDHTGAIAATGGGVATIGYVIDRGLVLLATGGGVFAVGWAGDHTAELTGTGGGVAVFDVEGGQPGETGIERGVPVLAAIAGDDELGPGAIAREVAVHATID